MLADVADVSEEARPAGHEEQLRLPSSELKDPASQLLQLVDSLVLYVPAGQTEQYPLPLEDTFPASQASQEDVPRELK